jgi:hypothetical protein
MFHEYEQCVCVYKQTPFRQIFRNAFSWYKHIIYKFWKPLLKCPPTITLIDNSNHNVDHTWSFTHISKTIIFNLSLLLSRNRIHYCSWHLLILSGLRTALNVLRPFVFLLLYDLDGHKIIPCLKSIHNTFFHFNIKDFQYLT